MRKLTKVAASVAAGMAVMPLASQAQDPSLEFYGQVEYRLVQRESIDLDGFIDKARVGLVGLKQLEFVPGVRARGQIEFDLPNNGSIASASTDSGEVKIRKAQVGLKGGFGELIVGRQNHLYADTYKIDAFKNDSGAFEASVFRIGNAITYVTPKFGDAVDLYLQIANDVGDDEEDIDLYTVGGSAAFGGLDVRLAYSNLEDDGTGSAGIGLGGDTIGLGVSYSFGPASVFGSYEKYDFNEVAGSVGDGDSWGLGVAYSGVEHLTLKAAYYTNSADNAGNAITNGDNDAVYLLADYELGSGVSTFVQYVFFDEDAAESYQGRDSALSVGIVYNWSFDALK